MSTKTVSTFKAFIGKKSATNAGVPYTNIPDVTVVREFVRGRTGVANPNFRVALRNDTNASTTFSGSEANGSSEPCDGTMSWEEKDVLSPYQWKLKVFKHSGYFGGLNVPGALTAHPAPTVSFVNADAIAVRNLYRKIDRMHHQFMGGVFVGQLGKAVKMVLSPAKSLRSKLSDYINAIAKRRGNVNPKTLKKVIADTYLEYTYGWQPLLHDVRDAAKAVRRFSDGDPARDRFRVKGEELIPLSQTSVTVGIPVYYPSFPYIQTSVVNRRILVVYYGLFKGGILDSAGATTKADRLIALSGFDFASFAPTVWELIPWSFVIDYFSNIGDLITAVSIGSSEVKWITKVTIAESLYDIRNVPNAAAALAWMQGNLPATARERKAEGLTTRLKYSYRSVSRGVSTVPFPSLRFELPHIDVAKWGFDNETSKKWLNMAALAVGARPRRP